MTLLIHSAMRAAFEDAVKGVKLTQLVRIIRGVLKRKAGITYRKCLWAVQRGPQ